MPKSIPTQFRQLIFDISINQGCVDGFVEELTCKTTKEENGKRRVRLVEDGRAKDLFISF